MRDHGGDLDAAIARFGGDRATWIDLSTGINRQPWPLPALPAEAVRALPGAGATAACVAAFRAAAGAAPDVACLPLAGAQMAIRLLPAGLAPGRVGIVGPTYNEHAAAFARAGWQVTEVADMADLAGFDAAVLVNPNNPDGRKWPREQVLTLAGRIPLFVVDESFADADPALSLCPELAGSRGVVVLRSFGKFYGLAGLRLGFVLGDQDHVARIAEAAGPWPVSGPALFAGRQAYADSAWIALTRRRLAADAVRLDRLAAASGWTLVGGTGLFRLYDAGDAAAAQERLARHRIWSRRFPYSPSWLRLGLPGAAAEWERVAAALG